MGLAELDLEEMNGESSKLSEYYMKWKSNEGYY